MKQLYHVFATRNGVDHFAGEVLATSGLDALAQLAPRNMRLCGMKEDTAKTICIVRFVNRDTSKEETWYAQLAEGM